MKKKLKIILSTIVLTGVIYWMLTPSVEGLYKSVLVQKLDGIPSYIQLKNNKVYAVRTNFEELYMYEEIGTYYEEDDKYSINIIDIIEKNEIKPKLTRLNWPLYSEYLDGEPVGLSELSRLMNPFKTVKLNNLIKEKD